jgi:hypothetical protein
MIPRPGPGSNDNNFCKAAILSNISYAAPNGLVASNHKVLQHLVSHLTVRGDEQVVRLLAVELVIMKSRREFIYV